MSQEYALSVAIVIGAGLKIFGVEIDNGLVEGLIVGVAGLWIAIRRKMKGDINIVGAYK
jgi:hypothetical protein